MKKFYLKTNGIVMSKDSYSVSFSKTPLKAGETGVGEYAVVMADDEADLQKRLSFGGKGFHDCGINFVLNPIGQ